MSNRTAQRPDNWSFRADLPMVRESLQSAGGAYIRARTPGEVAALFPELPNSAQEAFCCVDVDAKNNVLDKRLVTLGLADATLIHPREVYRGAILNNAAAIIVVYNHPSGDSSPSAEDLRITKQLVEAGRIVDIRVLDHVIIGRPAPDNPGYCSLRERGWVQ